MFVVLISHGRGWWTLQGSYIVDRYHRVKSLANLFRHDYTLWVWAAWPLCKCLKVWKQNIRMFMIAFKCKTESFILILEIDQLYWCSLISCWLFIWSTKSSSKTGSSAVRESIVKFTVNLKLIVWQRRTMTYIVSTKPFSIVG